MVKDKVLIPIVLAGRILSRLGGVLLVFGLIFSLLVFSALVRERLIPPSLPLLIFMGILIDFACSLALLVAKDGTAMVIAGTFGLISSIFLVGGIIGDIGGILGIIGGALVLASEESKPLIEGRKRTKRGDEKITSEISTNAVIQVSFSRN